MELMGVIWDMDGVLVDTRDCHYQSWLEVLASYEIDFSEQKFRDTFGMNNRGILRTLLQREPEDELVQEISEAKESRFRDLIRGQARLLPGVKSCLDYFRDRDIPMAIASSAPPANINVLVAELKIGGYFSALVSGFDLPGKPDPAVFLKAADKLGAPPTNCLVFEDAIAGVEGARAAGMKCIAVTTTVTADRLDAADRVVDSLEDLSPEVLSSLFVRE